MRMKNFTRVKGASSQKDAYTQLWTSASLGSISMQVEGKTTQPSGVLRVISLQILYIPKRAPGSNLEGFL